MQDVPSRVALTRVCLFAILCIPAIGGPDSADAAPPRVLFDLPATVVCREIGPPESGESEWPTSRAGERIFEAAIPLSVDIRAGDANAVEQVLIEVVCEGDAIRIVDFAPQTLLESDVDGTIEKTTTDERRDSFGVSLGGGIPIPYGEIVAQVTPSANAQAARHRATTESAKRLPPMEAVVVSGTVHRGRGVFFKLRRTPRNTLEGMQVLSIRFSAPPGWERSALAVECRAIGHEKLLWYRREKTWSKAKLPIVLHDGQDGE